MAITSRLERRLAVSALLATACASHHADTSVDPPDQCWFVVYNRTAYALDVRVLRDATGEGTEFGYVQGGAELEPGQEVEVWLHFP
jgi:hypothetical protein